jgi:uncharacterized protein (TIGR03083 family)
MLALARAGLTTVVARYAALVESQADTSRPIPSSEWTVRDAAVHLAGSNHRQVALLQGDSSTVETLDKDYLAARGRRLIAENPETDPKKLAEQIRNGFAELMAVTATVPADQLISYHAGLRPTVAQLACIHLGEYLLHGYDIATASGVPWPIDPDHAALAVSGYRMANAFFFRPQAAPGLLATYHIAIPGTDPFDVCIAGGAYEEPAEPLPLDCVDCVISVDPTTALLVQSGRLSQWPAIALGRLTFAGNRPEVGPRFAELFGFP